MKGWLGKIIKGPGAGPLTQSNQKKMLTLADGSPISGEGLEAALQCQRTEIARLRAENQEIHRSNVDLEDRCCVLEAAVQSVPLNGQHSGLFSASRTEWELRNKSAESKIVQLEDEIQNLKTTLMMLADQDTSALPSLTHKLTQEIQQLQRKSACAEHDICELSVRIADLRAIAEPLASRIEKSRLERSKLNTETNRLARETAETQDLEQELRNEVRLHLPSLNRLRMLPQRKNDARLPPLLHALSVYAAAELRLFDQGKELRARREELRRELDEVR